MKGFCLPHFRLLFAQLHVFSKSLKLHVLSHFFSLVSFLVYASSSFAGPTGVSIWKPPRYLRMMHAILWLCAFHSSGTMRPWHTQGLLCHCPRLAKSYLFFFPSKKSNQWLLNCTFSKNEQTQNGIKKVIAVLLWFLCLKYLFFYGMSAFLLSNCWEGSDPTLVQAAECVPLLSRASPASGFLFKAFVSSVS